MSGVQYFRLNDSKIMWRESDVEPDPYDGYTDRLKEALSKCVTHAWTDEDVETQETWTSSRGCWWDEVRGLAFAKGLSKSA